MKKAADNLLILRESKFDYERWLIEYGFSHLWLREFVEDISDHVDMPRFFRQGLAADADLLMVATSELVQGDEVLMDYRQAGSANGSGAQPDRALSKETVRLRLRGTQLEPALSADELDQFLAGVWIALRYIPTGVTAMIRNGYVGRAAAHVGPLRAGLLIGCVQRTPVLAR